MQEFLSNLERPILVVNLDPANENTPYSCDIDLNELVSLEQVMEEYDLGPNGGLVYAIEFLEKNVDWLLEKLEMFEDNYVIFDCPGQVELYTHHDSMRRIFKTLEKSGYSLCCIQLIDSYYCSSAANYIAAVLTSLGTMIHLELPHINVLSKVDLLEKLGKLDFSLEFYANATNLEFLEDVLDRDMNPKFKAMNKCLIETVTDFGLVSFSVLDIQDADCVYRLLRQIDKANGYSYTGLERVEREKLGNVNVSDIDFEYTKISEIQERYTEDY